MPKRRSVDISSDVPKEGDLNERHPDEGDPNEGGESQEEVPPTLKKRSRKKKDADATSVPLTQEQREKEEKSHMENQERAYIAASRRSDRGLGARVQSARMASKIHKKRTGKAFKITEDIVKNEEMYEEEDDHRLRSFISDHYPRPGMDNSANLDGYTFTTPMEQAALQTRYRQDEVNLRFSQVFQNYDHPQPPPQHPPLYHPSPHHPPPAVAFRSYQELAQAYQMPAQDNQRPTQDNGHLRSQSSGSRPANPIYPPPAASARLSPHLPRRVSAPSRLPNTPAPAFATAGSDRLPTPVLSPGSGISDATSAHTPSSVTHVPQNLGAVGIFSPGDAYRQYKGLSQQSFFAPEHPPVLKKPTRAQTGDPSPKDLLGVGSEPPPVPGIHIENPSGFSRAYTFPLDHTTINQPLHAPPYFTTGRRPLRTPNYGTNHQPVQNLNYATHNQLGQHPHYSTNGQSLQPASYSADNLHLNTPDYRMSGEQLYAANQNTSNYQPGHRHSYGSYNQSAGSYSYSSYNQSARSYSYGANNQPAGSPSYGANSQAAGSPSYDTNNEPAGSPNYSTDNQQMHAPNQSANDQQLQTPSYGASSQESPAPDYNTNDPPAYIPTASTNDQPSQSSNYGTNYPPLHHSNYRITREELPIPDSTNDECLCPAEAAENTSYLSLPDHLVDPPGPRSRIGTPGGGEGDAWEDWVNPDGWPDQTQVSPELTNN